MNIVLFYHSLLSDWNHGNAHFLRGVATELIERGNAVKIYEPENNWSLGNLIKDHGEEAVEDFYNYYPLLETDFYNTSKTKIDDLVAGADLVIVHEWNEHSLVKAIGEAKNRHHFKLLFHDTHHRAVSEKKAMQSYDLKYYDGVLAYGEVIRNIYLKEKWAAKAWTWHEAADTKIFQPINSTTTEGDLVWIGNWGDDERTKELLAFLIEPIKELRLKAKFYGVRYPARAKKALDKAGIEYGGWLPNFKVPEVFSKYRLTVHVPRRPYVKTLPGIPTIRPFEALACAIPLISSPWEDREQLFRPGKDFQFANTKKEMRSWMEKLLADDFFAGEQTTSGLDTILRKHTCAHRVDELYDICEQAGVNNLTKQSIAS
jgi:spore maturation protein CgeB